MDLQFYRGLIELCFSWWRFAYQTYNVVRTVGLKAARHQAGDRFR